MTINVHKSGPEVYVWSCTKCGATGSKSDGFAARQEGVAHDRQEH
jgi:hypothetical protein